jgi:SPFH domain / Band 7 family
MVEQDHRAVKHLTRRMLVSNPSLHLAISGTFRAGRAAAKTFVTTCDDSVFHIDAWEAITALSEETRMRMIPLLCVMVIAALVSSCSNPSTPAGYVGYVVQQPIAFGHDEFIMTQDGPTSTGLGWRLRVLNVSVTPYTYRESFFEQESILSQDNLKVGFELSVAWRIRRSQVRDFVERFTTLGLGTDPEKVVRVAYDNYIKQFIRTFARDEVQRYNGLQIKNNIDTIDTAIAARMNSILTTSPFEIIAALVSDIRYPDVVANAVAQKIAATQVLEQKTTEIQITVKDAEKREKEAEGVARAMATIKSQLTPEYLQYEAIKAQLAMVSSPNHTVMYIPVGAMGVPLVGTIDMSKSPPSGR